MLLLYILLIEMNDKKPKIKVLTFQFEYKSIVIDTWIMNIFIQYLKYVI